MFFIRRYVVSFCHKFHLCLLYFLDGCNPPFDSIAGGCYYYSGGSFVASYNEAENDCQIVGGYLAMIKSGDENRAILDNYLIASSKFNFHTLGMVLHSVITEVESSTSSTRQSFDKATDVKANKPFGILYNSLRLIRLFSKINTIEE